MDQEPKLENATFTFSQETNCVDEGDVEELQKLFDRISKVINK